MVHPHLLLKQVIPYRLFFELNLVWKERNVIFNSFGFDLDPSGREINSKAEYSTSFKNIDLGLAVGYKSDPYHIKSMQDYWYASLGFSIKN
jgi:hypothetical protein